MTMRLDVAAMAKGLPCAFVPGVGEDGLFEGGVFMGE